MEVSYLAGKSARKDFKKSICSSFPGEHCPFRDVNPDGLLAGTPARWTSMQACVKRYMAKPGFI